MSQEEGNDDDNDDGKQMTWFVQGGLKTRKVTEGGIMGGDKW